jgi:hypothetical protein
MLAKNPPIYTSRMVAVYSPTLLWEEIQAERALGFHDELRPTGPHDARRHLHWLLTCHQAVHRSGHIRYVSDMSLLAHITTLMRT